jgi:DNA-binding PadR family transcriptional regulator
LGYQTMPRVNLPLSTEYALLGFLRQRSMYGYEIHQQLSNTTGLGLVWRLKQSQLYALLTKLEQEGLVTTTLELQDSRPPRKMFSLTQLGQQAFLNWIEQPVQQGRELRLDFLAKLYFARLESPSIALRLIERQRLACQDWLSQQQLEAAGLQDNQPYDWLVHKFRLGQIEAMLTWLDACQTTLIASPV